MLTEKEIDRLNGILKNKVFKYSKGLFDYDLPGENDFDFKFQILGYKKMISVGEYYDYLKVSVTLLNFRDILSQKIFLRVGKDGDFFNRYFRDNMYFFRNNLRDEIRVIMSMFEPNARISIENVEIEKGEEKESLQEQKMTRETIRYVVKDIVNILKTNEEGDFTLPDNDEGIGYKFNRFPVEFTLELSVEVDNKIDRFQINAEYSKSDDVIEMIVRYNPSKLKTQMYDIIGELNEIIAHELEHSLQGYRNEFPTKKGREVTNPLKYYLQPHEIPAQIAGFKRLSKIQKKPLEDVIRRWFDTHTDIHNLNNSQQEKVIQTLLDYSKS